MAIAEVLAATDFFGVLGAVPPLVAEATVQDRQRRLLQLQQLSVEHLKGLRRSRILQVHPDKIGDVPGAPEAAARVAEAWEVLGSETGRETYLQRLRTELGEEAKSHQVQRCSKAAAPHPAKVPPAAVPPAPEPKATYSSDNGVLQGFQKHHKVKLPEYHLYRNFYSKDWGNMAKAAMVADMFLRQLDIFLAEFDKCKNASERTELLSKHNCKGKGTIAEQRQVLVTQLCSSKSPVMEHALLQGTASSSSSSKPADVPPQDVAGIDVHSKFFKPMPVAKPSHPFEPLYLHPGVFQAAKTKGARQGLLGIGLGWNHKGTFRCTQYIVSRQVDGLRRAERQLEDMASQALLLLFFIVTPDGEGALDEEDLKMARSFEYNRTEPYVLAKVTFAYDAGGTMKAWNIAGTEAKQVRVHFIQRKCDGEAFNLHDLDGASLGVRDLTLEALQSLLATTPPIATKSEPVQSTSAAPSSPTKDVPSVPNLKCRVQPVNGDGRCFWMATLFCLQPHLQSVARNAEGIPTDKEEQKAEEAMVKQFRDGYLQSLLTELHVLCERTSEAAHLEAAEEVRARVNTLLQGDQVLVEDMHFMGLLTGNAWRCTVQQNARQCLPAKQHDAVYGRPGAKIEAHLSFRYGVTACGHPYGHFDAILPPASASTDMFYLPPTAPEAPRTQLALVLLDMVGDCKQEVLPPPVSSRVLRMAKRERLCKQEAPPTRPFATAPAPGETLVISDSESEEPSRPCKVQATDAHVAGAMTPPTAEQQLQGDFLHVATPMPRANGHAEPSERSMVLDLGSENIVEPSPAMQSTAASASMSAAPHTSLVQDIDADVPQDNEEPNLEEEATPVLLVREPWLTMLLAGEKTWELRTKQVVKHRGRRVGLGTSGQVLGFATITDCFLVAERKGQHFSVPPEEKQHFWLLPQHLEKHRCNAEAFSKLGHKGKQLYAWVFSDPCRCDPQAYVKATGQVTWASLPKRCALHIPSPPQTSHAQAFVALTSKWAQLLVTGRTHCFGCTSQPWELGTQVAVYNSNLGRFEGSVSVAALDHYSNQEGAARAVRERGLTCVPLPKRKGPMLLCQVKPLQVFAFPVVCPQPTQVRHLHVGEVNMGEACLRRPRPAENCTRLKGHAPAMALRSSCQHFLDRLCSEDLARLQENLRVLDGCTLRTASTCSGLDTCIPVVRETLAALGERFGTHIATQHVLSCEKEPSRQDFMLQAHGSELSLLVADCKELDNPNVQCIRRNTMVSLPQADMLVAGTSCVNLSNMNNGRAHYVGCLEAEHEEYNSCQSSVTYISGFVNAAKNMGCALCINENVHTILQQRKDKSGEVHRPTVEVVGEMMKEQGYRWCYRQLVSRDFLVPQRRTRAWSTASKGDSSESFASLLTQTFQDLQSHVHFKDIFAMGLPAQHLKEQGAKRIPDLLAALKVERSDYEDLFLDPSTSSARDVEHAVAETTCLRPTSSVYSCKLRRFLTGMEHLLLQGVFPRDFTNPAAVEELGGKRTLAMAFAGNAFTTTVLQANFLALLVHSRCWRIIRERQADIPRTPPLQNASAQVEDSTSSSGPATRFSGTTSSSTPALKLAGSTRRRLFGSRRKPALHASRKKRGENAKGKVLDLATKARYLADWKALKADPNCKHAEKAMLADIGKYPGLYSGALGKWAKRAAESNWEEVARKMPKVAASSKQEPRWLLAAMNSSRPGSGRRSGKLPEEVLRIAEEVLLQQLELGSEVTVPAVCNLLGVCIDIWNEEVSKLQKAQDDAALQLEATRAELLEQGVSEEELPAQRERPSVPALCNITVSKTPNALRKQADGFLRKFDFQVHKVSKPGKHLRGDAPQVLAVKEYVHTVIREGKAHPLLIGNFDQVWTTMYEPAARVIWKDRCRQGPTTDAANNSGRFFRRQRLVQQLRAELELEHAPVEGPVGNRHKSEDGYAQAGTVSNWRLPRTTTTLSWRNGDLGRLFISIADDKVTDAQLEAARSLRGFAHVERSEGSTHMWRGDTTIRYLDFLKGELAQRRRELGLEFTDGALVIADDAAVHRDEKYATLRKLWEEENNCILLGCDRQHPVQVPGGFGAAGAPNDQWHNAWRLLRRAWLRKAVGNTNNPAYGRTMADAQFDLRGEVQTHCPLMVSLQADVYALQCLRQHRCGNIIMSAWHRLGYIDVEELAKLKFGGDLAELDAVLSHVPRSMATLLNLDALPDLGLEAAAEELDNSKVLDALSGRKHVWWFHDEEDLCRPLPVWLNPALETRIAQWVKEHQGWEETLAQRGDKGLTPSQQKRFDAWTTQAARTIWVQPTRRTASLQGGKGGSKLVTVHLSMEPTELFVQLGHDRKPLLVRQYLEGEEWPQVLDIPPGLLQDAPTEVVPAAEEEAAADLHGDEMLLEGEEAGIGEQPQAAWDCVWVTASKEEHCCVGSRQQVYEHHSGQYSRLLPPREGQSRILGTRACHLKMRNVTHDDFGRSAHPTVRSSRRAGALSSLVPSQPGGRTCRLFACCVMRRARILDAQVTQVCQGKHKLPERHRAAALPELGLGQAC